MAKMFGKENPSIAPSGIETHDISLRGTTSLGLQSHLRVLKPEKYADSRLVERGFPSIAPSGIETRPRATRHRHPAPFNRTFGY